MEAVEVRVDDLLVPGEGAGGRVVAVRLERGPLPGALGGLREHGVPVVVAGHSQDDVAGRVAAVEVGLHLVAAQVRHALGAPKHAVAQRVGVPEAFVGVLEQPPGRAVLVHGDLFEDDLLLHVEVCLPQAGAHELAQHVEEGAHPVGDDRAEVDGALLAGEGVVLGAQLVEGAVDVLGAVALVALEHHVLEEVRHARHLGRLVARARMDEVAHAGGGGVGVVLAYHPQAVGQRGLVEPEVVAPHGLGPSVTTVGSGMGLAAR